MGRLQDRAQGFRGATLIQFVSRYATVILNLIITMVLSRILTPNEYGTVAVVTVFVGLFSIISNVGINAAVIQYRELTDKDCNALLSFTFLLGLGLALLFCVLSFPIAALYDNSIYVPLMCLASLSVIFNSLNMVPSGMLIRDKRFFAIGLRTIVMAVVCGAISIGLALAGWGVYALVLNSVLSAFGVVVWNLLASKLRFGNWHFREQLKLVGKFSGFQFAAQVIQYFIRNLDDLLVGLFLGSTALGFYDKAYKLAKYPVDYVPSTLTPVLKSFFSSAEDDLEKIYNLYFRVEKVLSILGIFFSVVMFFCAEELIFVFFGDQWGDSVAPLRMLSISVAFQMFNFTVFSVLEGAKRTDYLMRHTIINGCVTIGLLAVGLVIGDITVIAACIALGFILSTIPMMYYVIHKVFEKRVRSYLRQFLPEVLAGIVLCIVYLLIDGFMPENLILSLIIKLAIGIVVYFGLLWPLKQIKYIKAIFKRSEMTKDNNESEQ